MLDSPAFKKEGGMGYTLHVYTAGGEKDTLWKLLAVYMDTPLQARAAGVVDGYTIHVCTAGGEEGYTLHIYSADGGNATRPTPGTSILLVVERDTPCRSRHTASGGKRYTVHTLHGHTADWQGICTC
jgi:hypothetical protein